MILVVDNYDSFVYNLVQYLGELGQDVVVYRNDRITVPKVMELKPEAIVVSPGPCTPDEAGVSMDIIKKVGGKIPMLGVCLGHQSIIQALGGRVVRGEYPVHGKTSQIYHDGKTIYQGVENPFTATRYHSLIGEKDTLPDCLEISAKTEDGVVMGIRHKQFNIEGVQFHPESILTKEGKKILGNFINGSNGNTDDNNLK